MRDKVAPHVRRSIRSGRFIEVDQATLYVEDRGLGAPLVLLHGGLSSSATWAAMLPHLVEDFRVITPDSRGHGRSTNPSGTLSYAQLADDVAALIAALGVARPVVGGYSDGGQVALELGARHPEAASALIVGAAYPDSSTLGCGTCFGPSLVPTTPAPPIWRQVDALLGDVAELVKSRHPGGQEQWRALVEQTAPMWLDYPGLTPEELGAIDAPVLLFTGDRDGLIPLELIVSLYRALPDAELACRPNTDHFGAMMPERAELFAGMIRDFAVRRTSPG